MDIPPKGHILLVGEGDFSFCVAMVSKFPSSCHKFVLATSLETEESIKKHQNAAENIKWLRERSVIVKLDTDATKLHVDLYFAGRQFSRIIFNFPHVGGKSNHKKNRKLLNDFFMSAVNILDGEGQIMMTLCKGQGGTAADKPMRAWHDTWQVVSMAANSSLILVKALPFKVEEYDTYSSTGFRSLDKGFNTENAITHVFEVAESVVIPAHLDDIPLLLNKEIYTCPRYVFNKLCLIRAISKNTSHPVNKVYHTLARLLSCQVTGSNTLVRNLGNYQPLLKNLGRMSMFKKKAEVHGEADSTIYQTLIGSMKSYVLQKHVLHGAGNKIKVVDCFDDLTNQDKSETEPEISLVCHPVESVDQRCAFKDVKNEINILCCPVFKPCLIVPEVMPVSYHMVITWPLSHDTLLSHDRLLDDSHIESFQLVCKPVIDEVIKMITAVISRDLLEVECKLCATGESLLQSGDTHFEKLYSMGNLVCYIEEKSQTARTMVDKTRKSEIGMVYLGQCVETGSATNQYILLVTMDITEIACRRYGIADERLLWDEDHRVLSQFMNFDRELNSINICDGRAVDTNKEDFTHPDLGNHEKLFCGNQSSACIKYEEKDEHRKQFDLQTNIARPIDQFVSSSKPDDSYKLLNDDEKTSCDIDSEVVKKVDSVDVVSPSLFPMTFTHDMSFWENEQIPFDELKYCDIIRNVVDDNVISVELLDRFTDPKSNRNSRCYRLVFQSVVKTLSYDTSWKLQSLIRLEVEKRMDIVLR